MRGEQWLGDLGNGNGPGGTAGIVVAAADAPSHWVAAASFVCDGDDDHVEVNQAIVDVADDGGTVLLSPGSFHTSDEILLRSGVTLAGSGRAATLIVLDDASDVDVITNIDRGNDAAGVDDVMVRSLTVDGNADGQSKSVSLYDDASYLACIRLKNVRRGHVEGVHAHSATGYGIELKLAEQCSVWRCEVDANGDDGLSVTDIGTGQSRTRDVHVNRVRAHDNGRSWHLSGGPNWAGAGIEIDDGPTDVLIESCVMTNNGATGIQIHRHSGEIRPSRIVLRDSVVYDNAQVNSLASLDLREADDLTVDGCTVDDGDPAYALEVHGLRVLNSRLTGTGTGLDLEDCDDVEVAVTTIRSVSTGIAADNDTVGVLYTAVEFDSVNTHTSGDVTERYGAEVASGATFYGQVVIPNPDTDGTAEWALSEAPPPEAIAVVALNADAADAGPGWVSDVTDGGFTLNLAAAPTTEAVFGWHVHPAATDAAPLGTYAEEVAADSPFAWWRFEETAGPTAADEQENHDGTVTGADLDVVGRVGSGISFDGIDDRVNVGTLGSFGSSIGSAMTVELWAKWTGADRCNAMGMVGTGTSMLLYGVANGSGSSGAGNEEGRFNFSLRGNNGNILHRGTDRDDLDDGEWHHIVGVWNGTTINVYVDGQLDNGATSSTGTPGSFIDFTHALTLGANNVRGALQDFFPGNLDEVALYLSALSADRVAAHFAAADVPEGS